MPAIETADGMRLNYVVRGSGPETVVFSHSYWANHRHFEAQIAALEGRYRVIAFDHRDHGESSLAKTQYDLEDLVSDSLAILEQTCATPVHWVGLSTGGFVGMRIALRRPELFKSLTLMDTSAEPEPWYKHLKYQGMFLVLRTLGAGVLMFRVMREMFGASSLRDPSKAGMLREWRELMTKMDPHALIRFGKAIFGRDNVLAELTKLVVPTLVMAGAEDKAIAPKYARHMADVIPGARLKLVPGGGHLCTLEQPDTVNATLLSFLASV
jgi:3-oxoadipate enol-lactonase